MATRRRLLLMLAGFACLGGLALGGLWMMQPRTGPGVTKANFERIKEQMTLDEVQEMFGKNGIAFHGYVDTSAYCWENEDHSYAIVFFDDDRKVIAAAQWQDSTESIGAKIRRVTRWPWW